MLAAELILQFLKAFVRQALLFAQGFGKILHRLLAGAALPAFALRDLHVFHQVAQRLHQLGGFGHAAFLHQLLQLVEHLLQLVCRHLHALHVFRHLLVRVLLRLFGKLAHVIVQRVAQVGHQPVNLGFVGPVLDRLVQPVLRPAQAFERRGKIALFDQQGDFPQGFGHLIALACGKPGF